MHRLNPVALVSRPIQSEWFTNWLHSGVHLVGKLSELCHKWIRARHTNDKALCHYWWGSVLWVGIQEEVMQCELFQGINHSRQIWGNSGWKSDPRIVSLHYFIDKCRDVDRTRYLSHTLKPGLGPLISRPVSSSRIQDKLIMTTVDDGRILRARHEWSNMELPYHIHHRFHRTRLIPNIP